ncbi:MAG TPA: low temperature requirement protein A [Lapillicoccus sp.]|nr:low temperature requirement protein A [Lapillicoccus sp.]
MAEVVEGKRVTWAEAFFDLVVVLAVTQVATLLGEHHQWWGLARAFIILALVYRTWVVTSLQSNRLGRDSTRDRVTLFGVGLCGLAMAIAIPHAYDTGAMQFALAFWIARVLIWIRYAAQYHSAKVLSSMGIAVVVIGPLLVVGALLEDNARELVWFIAALLDLGLTAFFGRKHELIHYDHSHLMERYGLFVLIALGESIVDLSLPLAKQATTIRPLELLAVAVCFVVVIMLWWAYFDRANAAITSALEQRREHVVVSRHLAYGHFGIVGGIVTIAVGFEQMVTQPLSPMTFTHLNLLYGGAILMLVSMVYLRWTMSRVLRVARTVTVAALLVFLYIGLLLPGIVATAILALLLAVMLRVEVRWPAFASRGEDDLAHSERQD